MAPPYDRLRRLARFREARGKQGGSNVTVTYRHVPAQLTEGLYDLVDSSIRQSDSSSLINKQSFGHADREIFEKQGAQLEHGANLTRFARRQYALQECEGARIDPGRLALARPADAQHEPIAKYASVLGEPCGRARAGILGVWIDRQRRPPISFGQSNRQRGPLRYRNARLVDHDQDRVGVAHVPFGALRRICARRFDEQRIVDAQARRLRKILGPAAARAPASVLDPARDCRVERRAIDAALPAGGDLHGTTTRSAAQISWKSPCRPRPCAKRAAPAAPSSMNASMPPAHSCASALRVPRPKLPYALRRSARTGAGGK